jgi:hypothetical protein
MALALEEGRWGQLDLARYHRYVALDDPRAAYPGPLSTSAPAFVNYYSLDIGYALLVEAARLAFPTLPDNYLRALALQLVIDVWVVVMLFLLFSQWSPGAGLMASLLYVTNAVFRELVSVAFYYYWDVPMTLAILGALSLAVRRPGESRDWLTIAAMGLGFGVWLRATWWPLSLFFFSLVLLAPALRKKALLPIMIFALLAVPQVYRSSRARGHLALSTRAAWHVALVGLGYYPNPYGLEPKDESVFRLTREKYGIPFRAEDYGEHDKAARREYLSLLRRDPGFVIRSFCGRLRESLTGTTKESMTSYWFLPNSIYRGLCLVGLVLMVLKGGEQRLLGLAAAGFYLIYVFVTCLFYFVGVAYDSVSQASLLFLVVGLVHSAPVKRFIVGGRRGNEEGGLATSPSR